jgi:hypothetical protein
MKRLRNSFDTAKCIAIHLRGLPLNTDWKDVHVELDRRRRNKSCKIKVGTLVPEPSTNSSSVTIIFCGSNNSVNEVLKAIHDRPFFPGGKETRFSLDRLFLGVTVLAYDPEPQVE